MQMVGALALVVTAVLGLGAWSVAAGGAAVEQLRAKLPVAGEVMIEHEDAKTLRTVLAEGSSAKVVEIEKTAVTPPGEAMRVSVARAYETPYSVQIMSADTRAAVAKGDVILLSCWVRAPMAEGGASGLASVYLQTTVSPWQGSASVTTTCEREWKQVFASGMADRDFAAGGLQVAVHLGQQRQVIELAGLVVLNLGAGVDMAKLPRNVLRWDGMEEDAAWRAEAQRRIERYRMAEVTVEVVDAAGRPAAGVAVRVRQQKRAFTVGSFTNYDIVEPTGDGERMREVFGRLFNRATSPIYWADWGWPGQKDRYLEIARWTKQNGMTTRGHVMVYPGFRFMPAEVVKLKDDPQRFRERILRQVREISEATREFGFREYDVTNELRDCVDVHRVLGREAVVEWFAEARKHLPAAKMALNENSILTHGGATAANQDLYLDWYKLLKDRGQAPDVMGFQGHFGEDFTAPEKVFAILERFAKETEAELQITEFDINSLDETAQAAYTRDFMTICFSHPRVTGFTMWGIWEGDHWMPRAAFYRKDWSAKPNAKVLDELLTKAWWTDAEVRTDEQGRATVRVFMGEHAVTAEVNGRRAEQNVSVEKAGEGRAVRLGL